MRLLSYYYTVVCPDLIWKHKIENVMELNKLKNVVISTSGEDWLIDKNYSISAMAALETITGQKSEIIFAKKSIAAFKLRKGMLIGCKITLRGKKVYNFLDKLFTILLPLNDRRIVPEYVPNKASFNLSIQDLLLFPELEDQYLYFNSLKGIIISSNFLPNNSFIIPQQKSLISGLQYPCNPINRDSI